MKTDRTIALRIILTTFSFVLIAYIFYNSSFDAVESTEQSDSVLNVINSILRSLGFKSGMSDFAVRKTAHFVEYFALGFLLTSAAYNYVLRISRALMIALPVGLATAVADELIQLGSAGRSCEIGDIALDFSAVLAAAAIFSFIIFLIKRKRGVYTKAYYDLEEGR